MNGTNLTFKEVQQELEDQLTHSYLSKFIEKPVVDNDKLFILYTIMESTSYDAIKKKSYIITTMLVQIALDTHDLVHNTKGTEQSTKQRQLTVLAGDYYSGLYYYLLSKIDDIPMIHTLATAIKEINELKMSVYYKEFETISSFMDSLKQLESLLVKRVAEHMGKETITNFAEDWLLIQKLIKEKSNFVKSKQSHILKLIIDGPAFNIQRDRVQAVLEETIQKHLSRVEDRIKHISSDFSSITAFVNKAAYDNFGENITVLEEG
ncbi:heptaprenyl diphosphate synthase component 1 [Aquibacillus kalidii]|uniref:heptaprenyl diphosphate synthase component 1 n=1 Tax=Aquibacillus kalidii TaxID=2762597 RepID=UPI0016470B89|nr:heptaprenyl diphosphate synthase component 1 [Aquibacillus kalidii]